MARTGASNTANVGQQTSRTVRSFKQRTQLKAPLVVRLRKTSLPNLKVSRSLFSIFKKGR